MLSAVTNEALSFIYDDEGQTETVTGTSTNTVYGFDAAHRLVNYNTIGQAASYKYDGAGNRISATRNGNTTQYIHDAGGNLIAEANSSGTITRYYIHGLGLMAMVDAQSGELYVYHFDGTGHTVAMTDGNEQITHRYAYAPYGKILAQEEAMSQPFTYAGQVGIYTEADNVYYMRARYYDAEIVRFISEDPAGFVDGPNLYAYVTGNPIRYTDPTGLAVGDWWDLPANFNRSSEIANQEKERRPRAHNDMGDANRHAEWMRRTTQDTNTFTAWVAGTGHEIDQMISGTQPFSEMRMDLRNNSVGRGAGRNGTSVNQSDLRTLDSASSIYNPYSRNSGYSSGGK